MLCEYGADKAAKNADGFTPTKILSDRGLDEMVRVIQTSKPKRRVKIDVKSVQYKDQLDQLARQANPSRINECRYDPDFIGKGAMSCVYLAIDENSRREMALKRIDKTSFQKSVKTEIETLKKLEQNQNVINFYFMKEDEHFYYIALELMDGDLESLVQKTGYLNDEQTFKLARHIVGGLEFLHGKNMSHRDLKPGNILYREKPELCLKLADFDLAKHLNVPGADQTSTLYTTSSTSLCGTRGWMAPELVKREKIPSKETDMYALGLLLHFLFSKGFHPFHSSSISLSVAVRSITLRPHELETDICQDKAQFHKGLKPEQRHLVKCLLQNVPSQRPSSKGLMKQHCYFWSNMKKVEFMQTIGNQPEVAKPTSTPTSTFGSQLQVSSFGRNLTNWSAPISALYQEVCSRRPYDTSSVVGLIRFFRNSYAHFQERSPDRRDELLKDHFQSVPRVLSDRLD
ncbi:hypothetical protein QZH41_007255 [Actinostola sp. cb2023]|nr:hypothetical protein QZH41_007255 [Actinostola sp. cb2023]